MEKRIYNFAAGPAILPEPVLKEAQEQLWALPGVGMSILEISHRSKTFDKIIAEAKEGLKSLLSISDDYELLFLQGGASLQFSMVPLNLMVKNKKADYIVTGSWSKKAVKEAKRVGTVNIAASTEEGNFKRIPKQEELKLDPQADYVHFTSNNTIFGTEWHKEPEVRNVPLVCDASSDILHKKIDVSKYALIYAGAQKNIGPSGVTLVIIRKDLLERSSDSLHTMLNYKTHVENNSLYNTPNVFGIYIINLVCKWLNGLGGLDGMYKINKEKADILYKCIDESGGFYKGHAEKDSRSLMNITFNLASEDLEKKLVSEATAAGFDGLKGHRSVGGLRASIYNAFPKKGVEDLVSFMKDFQKKNG
ncbi:MAG: phosphoserine transaminase [Ignavibacteria bacterium RIFOXYB2_FULL_35_12]|nr:MAG: phosphoserine transaminase [Ignavibacteria bacterium GWC2_35_8]OGU61601.1 MAG: phosphoserine transaminase [Ignavibacteria bacterium GWF2_35_20]OGU88074.1 MAG: phosphoserine transaminase [Ignavibacteria bacterium RIFOXYA12_FULL_35_25]OGU93101.1 MAG: phosphoserine transaminase [Ignavibacteria bacterium RIFOXYB12_FULL_35_14]OGU98260.1 MAG: phosphoserine transaminase [Ignavibacteria bacterium RIFOXYC2_FULL_35_16]OGV03385.1 MAG: phosphoserine transaminase [Ignavibacteria bacterium RIFOXYB2_